MLRTGARIPKPGGLACPGGVTRLKSSNGWQEAFFSRSAQNRVEQGCSTAKGLVAEKGGGRGRRILAGLPGEEESITLGPGSLGPPQPCMVVELFLLQPPSGASKPLGIKRFNFQCRPIPEAAGVKKDRAPVGSEHTLGLYCALLIGAPLGIWAPRLPGGLARLSEGAGVARADASAGLTPPRGPARERQPGTCGVSRWVGRQVGTLGRGPEGKESGPRQSPAPRFWQSLGAGLVEPQPGGASPLLETLVTAGLAWRLHHPMSQSGNKAETNPTE